MKFLNAGAEITKAWIRENIRSLSLLVLFVMIYLVTSFLGWRQNLGIISGTIPMNTLNIVKGGIFIASYLVLIVFGPVLLLYSILKPGVLYLVNRTFGLKTDHPTE